MLTSFRTVQQLLLSRHAFCHTSPAVWNNLPQSVVSDLGLTVNTGIFKSRLRTALRSFSDTRPGRSYARYKPNDDDGDDDDDDDDEGLK